MGKPQSNTEIFHSWLNVDGVVDQHVTPLDEARRACRKLTDIDRDPATRSGTQLVAPGCALGCRTCFRTCAVNRIKLDLWTNELALLSGVRP